jgi:hypothetical protein
VTSGSGLVNDSTGVIQASVGSGGERSITGNLSNYGTVQVDSGVGLDLWGTQTAAPQLLQADGVISSAGTLVLQGGCFDFGGGAVGGTFYLRNVDIDVTSTVTHPSTLQALLKKSVPTADGLREQLREMGVLPVPSSTQPL